MTAVLLALNMIIPLSGPSVDGWASAYAPGVMEATVRYRLDSGDWRAGPPPYDWYMQAEGAIAVNDCRRVGDMATLIDPDGHEYRVLVADCGGAEPEGGASWMTKNNIVAELSAGLWERLTAVHERPLWVEVRYDG